VLKSPRIPAVRQFDLKMVFIRIFIPMQLLLAGTLMAQEICDNALDDDGDGLIDMNDTDCECEGFFDTQNLPSLIPNPSFETMNCCPSSFSQLNCAQSWVQATSATSDYQNTNCYVMPASPVPPPDGNGFVGAIFSPGWQEYVGSCLISPMQANTEYELNMQMATTSITGFGDLCGAVNFSPINITIFGNPSCNQLPFNTTGCPGGNWVVLGSATYNPITTWAPFSITITPTQNISAIMIGSPCALPGDYGGSCYPYFVFDNLILNETTYFATLTVNQTGQWCDDDIVLHAAADTINGTWQWYKGGVALLGENAANLSVSANGHGAGDYTAVYRIGNQCESVDISVVQPDLPTADFSTADVCFPAGASFTDLSVVASGSVTNWQWDFGDGNNSNQQNPSHTYLADGTYTVQLTVTTDINCTDSYSADVTIYPKPNAQFSATDGCLGTVTQFTDQSTVNNPDNVTTWQWDFGDANASATQNPTNMYASTGVYNLELIVGTNNSCADTVTATVEVFPPPVVDVSAPEECSLDDVQFVNNSSIPSGTIDLYDWNFGDGNTSAVAAPLHVYATPGTYTVALELTTNEGCTADTTFQLISYPNPVAALTTADVCADQAIQLNETSSVIAPGNIATYELDLGDNSGILNAVPATYQYGSSGTYNIELIVTTQQGCDDTINVQVDVNDLPTADFSFQNICEHDSVQFTDLSSIPSGNISNWLWDFGNGNTSTLQVPPYQQYPADAIYNVSLIVSSGLGCADTLEDAIEVYPVPIANFAFDSVCFPDLIQFTDLSNANGTYPITTWQWSFSDGQNSAAQDPSIDFGAPGTFSATLQVTNGPGCKSTISGGDAVVHPLPVADFPAGLATCFQDTIFFTDLSSITPVTDDIINVWQWDFADGGSSSIPSPYRVYQSAALYDVTLGVMTNHGCVDLVTKTVEIYPLPEVNFAALPQAGCQPLFVQFLDQSTIPAPYSLAAWSWYLGTDSTLAQVPSPYLTYNPHIEPLDVATYDIGLTVTSGNGCVSDVYEPDFITVYPKPEALFMVDQYVKDLLKPEFVFTDLSSENVTIWDWDFGDGSGSSEQHPVHWYNEVGEYPVDLIVETQYGCLDTIGYHVKVEPIYTFYIPNSFTPDNDGINETFYGQGEGYVSYAMWIYDRWGEELFYSESDQLPWDGSYMGQQVQQGTFVYRFETIDWQGHSHEYKGIVTVHR